MAIGRGWKFLLHRQGWHLLALVVLSIAAVRRPGPGVLTGEFLGLSAHTWFAAALTAPVAHQVFVWLAWRTELAWRTTTRTFGRHTGFLLFRIVFLTLFAARGVTIVGLAAADRGSLFEPGALAYAAAAALAVPGLWGAASVQLYFGVTRATGADHFDPAYRTMPFVRRGAFRHVPNAMYVLVFLLLWSLAAATGSQAAFVVAAFQHAYIWVHYWCTERPDMDMIYGDRLGELRQGAQ